MVMHLSVSEAPATPFSGVRTSQHLIQIAATIASLGHVGPAMHFIRSSPAMARIAGDDHRSCVLSQRVAGPIVMKIHIQIDGELTEAFCSGFPLYMYIAVVFWYFSLPAAQSISIA